jgi:hypothetical protein
MTDRVANALTAALHRLLRPLVRILLRNGVSVGDFTEHIKKVYVDVATEEFSVAGRKPSISRTALLTGLTRKEVSRLAQLDVGRLQASSARYNRAARVISGWVRDPDFADAAGEPTPLQLDTGKRSFAELVRRYGADVPSRAVLDELTRVGAIALECDSTVTLLTNAYVPSSDADEKLTILGNDVAELIATIDHNITSPQDAFFQRKVSYDRLPAGFLTEFRRRAAQQAQLLLEQFDREMSLHDLDSAQTDAPGAGGGEYRLASIGIYYHESSDPNQDWVEE